MYALSDASIGELRVFADQLDRQVQMHLHETEKEVANSIEKHGCRPLERLLRLGLVNASLVAVHAVHVTDEDQRILQEGGVSVSHCPRSNLKLGSGIAPVVSMLERGINVAVGTDGAASNNAMDMLSELRYAALLAKGSSRRADVVPAFKALRMGTIDAARLLGLDGQTGSIETGKWADLACIDLNRLQSQPVYDPVSQIIYACRADQVSDVWIAGRQQLENGKLVNIDEHELLARCMEWRNRIKQGRHA
jgi:5-methylthioadenosine/S-adenosylhomocysteine deaminase